MVANNEAPKFKFNPTQDGITTVLGPLKSQIMEIVWQMEQATASDVHHELQASRERDHEKGIAYTTVMTTMSRLFDKHILSRSKVGMSFVYTPAFDQAEFVNLVVKNVMDCLLDDFAEPVFHYLAEYMRQHDGLRQELSRILANPAVAEPAVP